MRHIVLVRGMAIGYTSVCSRSSYGLKETEANVAHVLLPVIGLQARFSAMLNF